MTYIVTDIEYDTDGEDVDLPETHSIDVPDEIDNEDEILNYITDKISDITEFCTLGFVFEKH